MGPQLAQSKHPQTAVQITVTWTQQAEDVTITMIKGHRQLMRAKGYSMPDPGLCFICDRETEGLLAHFTDQQG
jgi:hypothetical protein